MSVDSVQLEQEADEIFNSQMAPPEVVAPDSVKPEGETVVAPESEDADEVEPDVTVMAEQVRNAKARMTQATMEAAELRRQLQARDEELNRLTHVSSQAPQVADSPKPDERAVKRKQVSEDYPDVAVPIYEELSYQEQRLQKIEEQLGNVAQTAQSTDQRIRENSEKGERAIHDSRILKAHPDAFKIAVQDDFLGWVDRQIPMIREAIAKGTADDVVHTLNMYKASIKRAPTPDNTARTDAARDSAMPSLPKARSQNVNSQPVFTREQIKNMSQSEFNRLEPEIDKAMAQGLVQ